MDFILVFKPILAHSRTTMSFTFFVFTTVVFLQFFILTCLYEVRASLCAILVQPAHDTSFAISVEGMNIL